MVPGTPRLLTIAKLDSPVNRHDELDFNVRDHGHSWKEGNWSLHVGVRDHSWSEYIRCLQKQCRLCTTCVWALEEWKVCKVGCAEMTNSSELVDGLSPSAAYNESMDMHRTQESNTFYPTLCRAFQSGQYCRPCNRYPINGCRHKSTIDIRDCGGQLERAGCIKCPLTHNIYEFSWSYIFGYLDEFLYNPLATLVKTQPKGMAWKSCISSDSFLCAHDFAHAMRTSILFRESGEIRSGLE